MYKGQVVRINYGQSLMEVRVVPVGVILLFVASVLVFFGLAQRVLDHLRLSDLGAVLFLIAMIAGSFINIPILRGRVLFSLNVGGGLLPIALGIYILMKAGSAMEWGRALAGALITGGIVWGVARVVSFEHGDTFLDPMLIFGIVAGIVGYVAGRSRRGSFVAATWGLLLTDLGNLGYLLATGKSGRVIVGGAGVFDNIVLAGLLAVIIAELVGETREHMAGGPETGPARPRGLHDPDMEMSWEEDSRTEFAEELSPVPLENREELFKTLFADGQEEDASQIDDLEAEADPLKSAGEEGYPSQKGELEAVRDIYGDYDLQEEDEKSLEACENLEEDLLEAVVELAGERVEAAGRSTISLPGGVELAIEEEQDHEA